MTNFQLPRTLALLVASTALGSAVDFNRDVRPLLSDKCFACHGPDAKQVKGDLRLDLRESAIRPNAEGRAAIVPGSPEKSALMARLVSTDPDELMPPPEFHKELKPAEISVFREWIGEGAKYDRHWAYRSLEWIQPPPANPDAARNAIDHFVTSRLAREKIAPGAEADRVTLIRRLSFDLLGLPPTSAEVQRFVADGSEQAWEHLIDEVLKSPHYGERMAAYWLDLVRYADTRGYHGDQHQDVTPYRDYVINAFNQNLPFDRFTAEQLAGDLLPEPTEEQKIASGYNKLLMTTAEGGAQPKEYTAKYAADRVRNASSVWLGSTLGCAECHDHKYDPFTQKDFYSFAAFFADVKETPVGGLSSVIKLPTDAETRKLASLDGEIKPLEKEIREALAKFEYVEPTADALKEHVAAALGKSEQQSSAKPVENVLVDDAEPACKTIRANKGNHAFRWSEERAAAGKRSWVRSESGLGQDVFDHLEKPLTVGGGDRFFVSVWIESADTTKAVMLQFRTKDWSHRANWGDMAAIPFGGTKENSAKKDLGKLPKAGEWVRLEVPVEKLGLKAGDVVNSIACTISGGTVHWDALGLTSNGEGKEKPADTKKPKEPLEIEAGISFAAWEKWVKKENYKGIDKGLKAILQKAADKRGDKDARTALDHYVENVYEVQRPYFKSLRDRLDPLKKEREKTDAGILRTMVTERLSEPRMSRVLPRGNWQDESGNELPPAVPVSLGRLSIGERRATRADLANWLTSRDNPLTARVFVNRLWKILFGRGLASTLDDFGMQGTNPTHPELLDWLAMEFIASGWDVKHMVKLIALSKTYRQTSFADEALRARDPYNDLFARQGRFRLDAEMVRDNALKVSGLLVDTVGGRSVKPYQPEGYWVHLNFPKRTYENDEGDGLYRRGLYTYWCRTFLHPSLAAFDASPREECTVERVRSNTPQQALVMLNDPSYVEASRVFAERLLRDGGATTSDRIRFAYREALSREPSAEELKILSEIHAKHLSDYEADDDAAIALLANGQRETPGDLQKAELAAWTSVTRVVLNLHEFITRH
jgi:hypothetical protein